MAGAALAFAPRWPVLWLVAAAGIQLRLLANLLDGLVAIEGGRSTPTGALWNEIPDRIEDTAILAGFGLAAGSLLLGLAASVAALFCAYLRVLGGALGQPQDFSGPMAKQHRMAALTAGSFLGLADHWIGAGLAVWVLWLVFGGTLVTAGRRTLRLARALEARG